MLRKILAYLFGHVAALEVVAAKSLRKLGPDILDITPQERGERIKEAVKAVIEAKYPYLAPYEGVAVDFVADRIRKALANK